MENLTCWKLAAVAVATLWLLSWPAITAGQDSSLLRLSAGNRPPTLDRYSWTYQKPVEPAPLGMHDLVTVVINEHSVVVSEGQMDRKKKAHQDLILKNWVLLKGLRFVSDPQTGGAPHVRGEVDNKMRSESQLETRDSMKFRIACTVVDVRPNGNLVIEGRRVIRNNEDVWEYYVAGEIRAKDVLPNNTILSENVADLRIHKRELGHVRDGYRRGWMMQWLDQIQPF